MTASSPAHQRRKQHAPARRKGGRSNATRKATRGARRPQSDARERLGKRAVATERGLLGRLRERIAGRRRLARTPKHAESAAESTPERPREWPRRLGLAALKFGSAAAVAWALLVAGREVYEYATTSSRFEVQHFIYETTTHVDDEQLRTLLSLEPGTNILACDLPGISERIAAHPWVAQATVIRHLPDTLEVTLIEHEPEAIVLAERFYLVNGEGKPFKPVERGERGELPIITGIDRAQLADNRDAAVVRINSALALIRLYGAKQRPRLGEIHIAEDGEITLYTAEAGTQLRLGRGGFEDRLARWDALRAALGDRADRLAVVHLDHESKPDRRDRVVARFASERDEAVLLAAAAGEPDQDLDSPELAAAQPARELPARSAGHRKRIPRYE